MSERKYLGIRGKGTIKYTPENDKIWVSTYKVSVRVDSGKKWINLGIFNGNNNRVEEVVNRLDIDINVRYVRVIPLTYVNYACMQISLFGINENNEEIEETPDTISYFVPTLSKFKYIYKDIKRAKWNVSENKIRRNKLKKEIRNKLKYDLKDYLAR